MRDKARKKAKPKMESKCPRGKRSLGVGYYKQWAGNVERSLLLQMTNKIKWWGLNFLAPALATVNTVWPWERIKRCG
jgi:hypothetical protein